MFAGDLADASFINRFINIFSHAQIKFIYEEHLQHIKLFKFIQIHLKVKQKETNSAQSFYRKHFWEYYLKNLEPRYINDFIYRKLSNFL